MSNKLFRKSLFGFNKRDVMQYLDVTVAGKIQEKENEILQLNAQIASLNATIQEFDEKREEIALEREDIANAILIAQEDGRKIIEEAKQEAKNIKSEVLKEIAHENARLREIQLEIGRVRRASIAAVTRLSSEIKPMAIEEEEA